MKYTDKNGVKFWAEKVDLEDGNSVSWHVVSQAKGYDVTEAFDDWLCHKKDADEVARLLSEGKL